MGGIMGIIGYMGIIPPIGIPMFMFILIPIGIPIPILFIPTFIPIPIAILGLNAIGLLLTFLITAC